MRWLEQISWPKALLLIGLFTLLNAGQIILVPAYGDIIVHYAQMHCFAGAFWQGDLRPQWCMEVDAGVGSPVFYFYYPLAYYVTAIFYPLTWLGMTLHQLYYLCILLATFVSGVTAFIWLRGVAGEKIGLMAALLYLFLPYRLEILTLRAAYGEIWCMAFLPLVMHYARRVLAGGLDIWPLLAFWTAVCLLFHVPAAVAGLIALGIVLLVHYLLAPRPLQPLLRLVAAFATAGLLIAFYATPAVLLKPYVDIEITRTPRYNWPNHYLNFWDKPEPGGVP